LNLIRNLTKHFRKKRSISRSWSKFHGLEYQNGSCSSTSL